MIINIATGYKDLIFVGVQTTQIEMVEGSTKTDCPMEEDDHELTNPKDPSWKPNSKNTSLGAQDLSEEDAEKLYKQLKDDDVKGDKKY